MKRRKFPMRILALLHVIGIIYGGIMFFKPVKALSFQESRRMVHNPMQGFYIQIDTSLPEKLGKLGEEGVSLALLAFNMNGCQKGEIPDEKLEELKEAFAMAKKGGVQVIFRGAYGFREGMLTKEPEWFETVLGHIDQIAPVLNEYKDIIVCVQAGMLGPWGEWHSSSFFPDEETEKRVRCQVAAKWNETLDPEVQLQLRTPEYIRDAVAWGVPIERMGFHNDALLSSESDMGTYRGGEDARQEELEWVGRYIPHSRTGGEVPQFGLYSPAAKGIPEFGKLRLTYLNSKYNEEVLESWKEETYQEENAYEYIKKHLGSRLYLKEARIPERILSLGKKNKVSLILKNCGFAEVREDLAIRLVMVQGERMIYVEPEKITMKNTGVEVRGNISFMGMQEEVPVHVGIWTGYGSPEAGLVYELANEEEMIQDKICLIGQYHYKSGYWEYGDPD